MKKNDNGYELYDDNDSNNDNLNENDNIQFHTAGFEEAYRDFETTDSKELDEEETELYNRDKKPTFMQKILNFITGKDYEEKVEKEISTNSIFEEIVEQVPEKSENFVYVREAADLSEEALRLYKQKIIILNRTKQVDEKVSEMSIFNTLSQVDIDYLKMILNRYVAIVKEKNVTNVQISSFDRSVVDLYSLESDAIENLPKIEDAERMQRVFKTDINHIEGEKEELLDEMDTLIKGRDFFKKFTYCFVGVSVLMATFLSFMGIFYQTDIFMQLFVLIIVVMFVSTFIVVFRRKIKQSIRRNVAFQKRAVELLNKKNAVYAYYTSFLNYEYKKYHVNSSMELKENLRELVFYKQHLKRGETVRRVLRESEYEIDDFMKEHNIKNDKISMLDFAETINIEDQRRYFDSLIKEKSKAEETLKELDEKHELVWAELMRLKENDTTQNHVVSEIIDAYYVETAKDFRLYTE